MSETMPSRFVARFESQLRQLIDPLTRADEMLRNRKGVDDLVSGLRGLHVALERLRRLLRDLPRDFIPKVKPRGKDDADQPAEQTATAETTSEQ